MFKYLLLSLLLFGGLFGADTTYDQVLIKTTSKAKAKIKLVENNDSTYSVSTSVAGTVDSITVDSAGSEVINGIFGEAIAESKQSDILVSFQYNYFDEQFDVLPEVSTGDGTSSVSSGLATVSSAITGTVYRASRNSIRYKPAHTGYAFFTASFEGTGIGRAGCANEDTGFALKVSNGSASFGYIKAGVETGSGGAAGFDEAINWDNADFVANIDFNKLNIFLVTYGYLGSANPTLWIKLDYWVPLHTVKTEGRLTTTHIDRPVFPIGIYAENNMTVSSGSWSGGTLGIKANTNNRSFAFPNTQVLDGAVSAKGEMTLSGTNVGTIAIFRSKALFKTIINNVKARLTGLTFKVDTPAGAGTKIGNVTFQIVNNPTLDGNASYSDVNTNSSVMEYDHNISTGASVNATLGIPIITKNVDYASSNKGGSSGDIAINAEAIGAFAYANDVFAIVAKDNNGNNVTVRLTLEWEELF